MRITTKKDVKDYFELCHAQGCLQDQGRVAKQRILENKTKIYAYLWVSYSNLYSDQFVHPRSVEKLILESKTIES